jgi:GDP-4-dehydro-6-deoxy-D-mannose reductase
VCDKNHPPTENDPPASDGAGGVYAESKILAEQETIPFRAFTLTTRAFNHTGPGQAPAFVVPGFARQIAHIERGDAPPVMKVGNLQAERDFLDVRDVVHAYVLLMERGTMGETYNVCSGNTITIQSVLDRLRALSQVETQVEQDPARMRPSDIPVSVGDPSKLKKATDWEPTVPFDTTLRDTLTYWRSQH